MARSGIHLTAALLVAAILSATCASTAHAAVRRQLQEPTSEFPPGCKCDRDKNHSPFRLEPHEPSVDGSYIKYCFTVTDTAPCDPAASKCCNKTIGVEKVEFKVAPACKSSLKKVTIDGVVDPGFEYNTNTNVLRITDIGADKAGTQVCLFLKADAPCTSMQQVCVGQYGSCTYSIFNPNRDCCPVAEYGFYPPPPPFQPSKVRPPAPPPSFPYCKCDPDASHTLYSVGQPSITTNATANTTTACFGITRKPLVCAGPCCEFDLYKVEIDGDPTFSTSLLYSTVDGVKKSRFFQVKPYPVVKVTPIKKSASTVDNTQVCLVLRGISLADICAGNGCKISLFSSIGSQTCCPTFTVSDS